MLVELSVVEQRYQAVLAVIRDQIRALEVLELAQRQAPYCGVCGSPTSPSTATARSGSSVRPPRPFLRKLLSLDFRAGHTRRVILEDAALATESRSGSDNGRRPHEGEPDARWGRPRRLEPAGPLGDVRQQGC
jgi:hypothetical protein